MGGPTKTGAFCFADSRAMGPWPASLCLIVHAVTGFSNKSLLLALSPDSSARDYTRAEQMTYDLHDVSDCMGSSRRVPHTNTYTTTPEGIRVAVFYTKLHRRLLAPLLEARPTTRTTRPTTGAPDDRCGSARVFDRLRALELPLENVSRG